jgi:hypothetical protein
MPIVQCLRTGSKPYTHRIVGEEFTFAPNELGHLICRVDSQPIVDIMLGYEGRSFMLYAGEDADDALPMVVTTASTGAPEGGELEPEVEAPSTAYIIGEGENQLDLRTLTDKQLHEFCKANAIEVNARAKGDTIRDRIVASLTEATTE